MGQVRWCEGLFAVAVRVSAFLSRRALSSLLRRFYLFFWIFCCYFVTDLNTVFLFVFGMKKSPVKLRRRVLASGAISLYLDIYFKGKRQYEFLGIYLEPETSRAAKVRNREALDLAETVVAKRSLEVRQGYYGLESKRDMEVSDFCDAWLARRDVSPRSFRTCARSVGLLCEYLRSGTTFGMISNSVLADFVLWLKGPRSVFGRRLNDSSISLYLVRVRQVLRAAVDEGYLEPGKLKYLGSVRARSADLVYLTKEEIGILARSDWRSDSRRRAFLFSCLTGLRRSDVQALRWRDVERHGEFTRLVFRQKKTGRLEYLDISDQAEAVMGPRGDSDECVFRNLGCDKTIIEALRRWMKLAGIDKRVVFHSARHSFAVMMLELGTDIYTVSKLLGHSNIKTTMIYAKVTDRLKQEAARRIPRLLPDE